MIIREVLPSEFDEVAKIAELAWSEKPVMGFLTQRLKQPNSRAWIAIVNGQIVGTTTATIDGSEANSEETAVLPMWRHLGTGQKLLDAMKQGLRKLGIKCVYGESSSRHPRELDFFIGQGFESYKVVQGGLGFQKDESVYLTRLYLT